MSSTTVTCSRKKSLRPSLVPQHVDSDQSSQEQVVSNALYAFARQEQRTVQLAPCNTQPQGSVPNSIHQHQPSINEMASALLDDTTQSLAAGVPDDDAVRPVTGGGPKLDNFSYPRAIGCYPLTQASKDAEPPVSYRNLRPKPVSIQKASPKIPRKSSKRNRRGTIKQRRTSPQSGGNAHSGKNIPKSTTGMFNPLAMNPPKLVTSASMPLDKLSKQLDDGSSRLESSTGPNSLNINHKVDLMLAATKSLKPIAQVNPQQGGTASKMSRIFVKNGPVGLLRKVTNVWKGHLRDTQHQQQESHGAAYVPTETLQSLTLPEQVSPITTIELRLNEGKNLNRDKVQKMMGGGIQRKPVPEDGNSLRDRKSYEDPFSEAPSRKRPPTKFENRLRENSVDESTMPLLPLDKNPFETERILESGTDSILSSAPIASSTPRIRVDRFPTTSESPTKKSRSATGGNASEDGDDTSCNSETPLQGKPKDDSASLAFSDGVRSNFDVFDEGRLLGGVFPYVPVVDNMEMKKHPSPGKGALERMMKEFRAKYPAVPLGPAADHDTTDELAYSPSKLTSVARPLEPVDKNRRFGGYLSLSSDGSTAASESLGERGRDGTPHDAGWRKPVRTMAVVKPVGITRSHTESQFTLHGCPRHIEMDELQMDAPSVTHGYAPLGSQEVY
ncbi:hypothetical protein B0T19DRAFT_461073 [Cercophora scortea]|uniref:Uncharacterized protein n=1 Tax=Cercophora scortea TaxID=314031 RepID=A0AAE0MD49_9PEZI|nr:hypothetical protein B0T19DRAFT_461073 [Cercophora scortea]